MLSTRLQIDNGSLPLFFKNIYIFLGMCYEYRLFLSAKFI